MNQVMVSRLENSWLGENSEPRTKPETSQYKMSNSNKPDLARKYSYYL